MTPLPLRVLLLLCLASAGEAAWLFAASDTAPTPGWDAASPTHVDHLDPATTWVYVPNQVDATISIFEVSRNACGPVQPSIESGSALQLLAVIDLEDFGFSQHAMPHHVAVEPDGSAWYVTLAGDGFVARFSRDNQLVARARFEAPGMIVLDPARDRAYVSRAIGAASAPSSLGVFRASDLEPLEEADVFITRPHALAVDTVSGRVYTASLSGAQIAEYDPTTGRAFVSDAPGAPAGFVGLAASPSGERLVATTQLTNLLIAFDISRSEFLEPLAAVPVAAGPYDVAFAPDGRSVWFPNQAADAVTRVDASTWVVSNVIEHEAFAEPHGVAFSPDGSRLYISSHGHLADLTSTGHEAAMAEGREPGTLVVIDPATQTVCASAPAGRYAAALGVAALQQ